MCVSSSPLFYFLISCHRETKILPHIRFKSAKDDGTMATVVPLIKLHPFAQKVFCLKRFYVHNDIETLSSRIDDTVATPIVYRPICSSAVNFSNVFCRRRNALTQILGFEQTCFPDSDLATPSQEISRVVPCEEGAGGSALPTWYPPTGNTLQEISSIALANMHRHTPHMKDIPFIHIDYRRRDTEL